MNVSRLIRFTFHIAALGAIAASGAALLAGMRLSQLGDSYGR